MTYHPIVRKLEIRPNYVTEARLYYGSLATKQRDIREEAKK